MGLDHRHRTRVVTLVFDGGRGGGRTAQGNRRVSVAGGIRSGPSSCVTGGRSDSGVIGLSGPPPLLGGSWGTHETSVGEQSPGRRVGGGPGETGPRSGEDRDRRPTPSILNSPSGVGRPRSKDQPIYSTPGGFRGSHRTRLRTRSLRYRVKGNPLSSNRDRHTEPV